MVLEAPLVALVKAVEAAAEAQVEAQAVELEVWEHLNLLVETLQLEMLLHKYFNR